jgi:hypothetical protein
MKKEVREKLFICLVVWPTFAAVIAGSIWGLFLFARACDWFFGELRQLKQDYITANESELTVVLFAMVCLICLAFCLFIGLAKSKERSANVAYASFVTVSVSLCWLIYLFPHKHMSLWFITKCFGWCFSIGLIGGGLEKNWKICYAAFWALLLLSANEHFMLFSKFSMTGLKPENKGFLDYHFGLTQFLMLSLAGVLLATPSAFKWIWFESEQERARIVKEIFDSFNRAEAPLPDAQSDHPASKDHAGTPPEKG